MKKIVVLGPESTGKSFLCEQLATHYQSMWVPEFARNYLEKKGPAYQYEDLYEIAIGQLEQEDLATGNGEWGIGNGQLAIGNRQLEIDNRQWAIGDTQSTIGNGELTTGNRKLTTGNRKLTTGNRKLTTGKVQPELQPSTVHPSPSTVHRAPSTFHPQPLFLDTDLYTIKIWSEISFNKCDNRILSRIAEHRYDLYLFCNTDLPWAPDPLREYPDLKMRRKIYHYYKDALVNQEKPWIDISGNYEERFLKAVEAVDRLVQSID